MGFLSLGISCANSSFDAVRICRVLPNAKCLRLMSAHLFSEIFNRALALMNQAVSGTLQPGAKENIAYLTSTERR